MERRKYQLTMKELNRYRILKDVLRHNIPLTQGARLIGISYRQALRLKKRVMLEDIEGIISRHRTPHNRVPNALREKLVALYIHEYGSRFNILHFKEKLEEKHCINLSYETIRQILIKAKCHKVKHHRHKHRSKRKRMPYKGMLLQMDSSQHKWIESIKEKWWLISVVDDATSEIIYAQFYPSDTMFSNMEVIKKVIKKKGVFLALYVDKASHFKTTRYSGLWYDNNREQEDTNIQKALDDLGITLITANSPQAKGRVERSYRTLQDRLINEMWLAKIDNYNDANKFLKQKFFKYYNYKFAKNMETTESRYRMLTEGENLEMIFTIRKLRRVKKDNTIKFYKEVIQLPEVPKLYLLKSQVEVRLSSKNKIWILYKNKVIHETYLSRNNEELKYQKKVNEIMSMKEYAYDTNKCDTSLSKKM